MELNGNHEVLFPVDAQVAPRVFSITGILGEISFLHQLMENVILDRLGQFRRLPRLGAEGGESSRFFRVNRRSLQDEGQQADPCCEVSHTAQCQS